VSEKGPNDSWVTSRASCKVTVTGPTITSAEPESSTRRAGRMPGDAKNYEEKNVGRAIEKARKTK
jgi:hypothetical protein